MKWNLDSFGSYASRVRRTQREIVIASVLTLAALAFLVAALFGGAVNGTQDLGPMAAGESNKKQ
jgi:hypothetical protein